MWVLIVVGWLFGVLFLALLWFGIAMSILRFARRGLERSEIVKGPIPAVAWTPGVIDHDGAGFAGTFRRGLVTGVIGYAVVVGFYVVMNLASGGPALLSPALLGRVVLGMPEAPAADAVQAAPVLVYNGLHLVVFLCLGMATAWLWTEIELHPRLWYLAFILLLFAYLLLVGAVLLISGQLGGAVSSWSVILASAAAAAGMLAYLAMVRPETVRSVRWADRES